MPDDLVYAALLKVRTAMRMRYGPDRLPRAKPDELKREQAAVFVRVPRAAYDALERRGLLEYVPGLGAALRLTEAGHAEIAELEQRLDEDQQRQQRARWLADERDS